MLVFITWFARKAATWESHACGSFQQILERCLGFRESEPASCSHVTVLIAKEVCLRSLDLAVMEGLSPQGVRVRFAAALGRQLPCSKEFSEARALESVLLDVLLEQLFPHAGRAYRTFILPP